MGYTPEHKISIQIWLAIYRKYHLAFNHSIANNNYTVNVLILISQIVKLVGKWPMINCYFVLCTLHNGLSVCNAIMFVCNTVTLIKVLPHLPHAGNVHWPLSDHFQRFG